MAKKLNPTIEKEKKIVQKILATKKPKILQDIL
jgi:hypothetical protein